MSYFLNFSLLFRNRNFALLYIGQFVSFLGTAIVSVGLPYQIYHETHSTLMVGLLSLFQLIPLIFTALIGGVFADRYHRKYLLIASETILSLGSLTLALNSHAEHVSILLMFSTAALMSAFNGLHRPALESMVQQIVDKKDFGQVSSLSSLKGSVCLIGGPAIGGLIIAYFGVTISYVVDFLTFLVSLIALLSMTKIPKPNLRNDISPWKSLTEGVSYAFSRQELMGTYFVDFIAMIFGMPSALFPAIAMSLGGAKTLGFLYSAPAVGALIISLYSGWTEHFKRHGAAIAIVACGWGVAIIAFGIVSNLYLALFFLVIAGAFDGISGIFRSVMWNQTIPNELRGRLAGIEMISYLSGPKLGDTEAGLVSAAFGIPFAIISGGVLCVVGVVICCYRLPKFWHYRAE